MSAPVLWHIPVSHYNEKVRWALAWKGIEHERRAPPPPAHMLVALWLTRGEGSTFPVLELDGRAIGDSSAIIAALEQRWPEPALYPADAAQRARALELEGFFDEQLGPHIRLLGWHELRADRERMERLARAALPDALGRLGPVAGRLASAYVQVRFRVASDDAAEHARAKVIAAMDRLDAELERPNGGGYLAGEEFSVADLTAASLFYPLVNPPQGPRLLSDPPPALEAFRASLAGRPGYVWVEEMYRRHRKRAPAPEGSPAVPA